MQLWDLGERCKLPSEVWGGAPAEIEFDAFLPKKLRSGGTNFTNFVAKKVRYFKLFSSRSMTVILSFTTV